jgi:hypothetical protein
MDFSQLASGASVSALASSTQAICSSNIVHWLLRMQHFRIASNGRHDNHIPDERQIVEPNVA